MQCDRYFVRDLLFGLAVFFVVPVLAPALAEWIVR